MEQNIEKRMEELEKKVDQVWISVEKTRKYIMWTGIITLAFIVLPIIGLMFAIPAFLKSLDALNGLGI